MRQAGQFGIPQTRHRAFILAAAPGQVLPEFPEPTHTFSKSSAKHIVKISGIPYNTVRPTTASPYRAVTVRDALSDLPEINNGSTRDNLPLPEPLSDFQRRMRGANKNLPTINDHICKEMNPLVYARICHIPRTPGSDWRDLPNIEMVLSDGTVASKLVYTHNDRKQGLAKNGSLRGVCLCAEGKMKRNGQH